MFVSHDAFSKCGYRWAWILSLSASIGTFGQLKAFDVGWRKPLSTKEREIEANILQRHNILGLYPSMVEVPIDGSSVDITTSAPFSDAVHAVAWTSHYLAGASYRYAWLRQSGADQASVDQAKLRADEIFEAVYRCQRVTGRRGLLARGYFIGSGPTFDERRGASHRDDWHQGEADGYALRFCAGPSHHIYSAAAMGMGQYYDLVAEGLQKERAREAIDALVSYWVDNDYKIEGYDDARPPVPILGLTDGQTLNTRVMMAISACKIALHATGKAKFKEAYEDLLSRYQVRALKSFRVGKGYDDAHHVFAHLDLLDRIETEEPLRQAYGVVADGLWQHYQNEGHSHFTYIYYKLRPNAPGKDKAMRLAHHTLATWPTDMTIQPIMSDLPLDGGTPYPVYATGWDNEFIWKGDLNRPNAHHSRIAKGLAVSPQSPNVAMVVDPSGHLYLTHDQGRSASGWKCVSDLLKSPVKAAAFGKRTRIMAVACEDGFYLSETAGHEGWFRLPLEYEGVPEAVLFDPNDPNVIYAMTGHHLYQSIDHGEDRLGRAWNELSQGLPKGFNYHFHVATSKSKDLTYFYAQAGSDLYVATSGTDIRWKRSKLGLGEYGESKHWLAIDPHDPRHVMFGVRFGAPGTLLSRTVLQQTRDGGESWSANQEELTKAYYQGGLLIRLMRFPSEDLRECYFDHEGLLAVTESGQVLRSKGEVTQWTPIMDGLDIPRVDRLFVPHYGDLLFASTPAGMYQKRRDALQWEPSHLVMQWRRHERRELGGAAFITAYWRALYFGHIDPDTIQLPYEEAKGRFGFTSKTVPW